MSGTVYPKRTWAGDHLARFRSTPYYIEYVFIEPPLLTLSALILHSNRGVIHVPIIRYMSWVHHLTSRAPQSTSLAPSYPDLDDYQKLANPSRYLLK